MNILNLLMENLLGGPVTVRFPDRPPTSAGYRGLVEYDQKLCEACGLCAFVCTSAAIISKRRRDAYDWSYDPGQCTFCARCIEVCEPHALTMQAACPPVYAVSGELKHSYSMPRKAPVKKSPPAPPANAGAPR
jgi:formate hydrogenlyase subunit 6/NADH:ubiquinone oxidoreductase subunit I